MMNNDVKTRIALFIKIFSENKALILSFLSIFLGIIIGASAYNLPDGVLKSEILPFVLSFNTQLQDKTNIEIFSGMLLSGFVYFVLMFFIGGNVFGKEVSLFLTLIKTSGIGAVIAHLYRQYGAEGLEYILLIFIPGKIFFVFSVLFITKCCFETSSDLRSGLQSVEAMKLIKTYSVKCVFAFIVMFISWTLDFICLKVFSGLIDF